MSSMAKHLRAGAKSKAQARVGAGIKARKAYLPELAEAHKVMKRAKPHADGGKIEGAKAAVRADKRPRKAGGGQLDSARTRALMQQALDSDSDGLVDMAMIPKRPSFMEGLRAIRARPSAISNAPVGATVTSPFRRDAAREAALAAAIENPTMPGADPVPAERHMANRAMQSRPSMRNVEVPDDTILPTRYSPLPVQQSPLATTEVRAAAPTLAPARRAPTTAPESGLTAERLNQLSQLRSGANNAAEMNALDNMAKRRAQIEAAGYNQPGGVPVEFDESMLRRRGGAVNNKFRAIQKSGKQSRKRAR